MIQFRTVLRQALRCGVCLCLSLGVSGSVVSGQVTVEKMPGNRTGRIYRMKISPAAEPSPIFKHRFCVPPRETIAANAATSYLRSFGEGSLSRPLDEAYEAYGYDDINAWHSVNGVPIESLLDTPAKKVSQTFDGYVKNYIERATRCRYCDWGLAEEDLKGDEVMDFLLPSVQQTRSISRVLALQTRVAIAEKRFDRAADLMRMNYQLGRSVGKMKFLVAYLVGLAEVGITNNTMIDMVATPGSPNMYYALSELPRPMVDLRESFRMEMSFLETTFTDLFDAEVADLGLEGWREQMSKISSQLYGGYGRMLSNISNYGGEGVVEGFADNPPDPSVEQLAFRVAPTVVGVFAYGPAKQQLIDGGADSNEVEAMPVAKVITVAACQSIRSRENKNERWLYQPLDVAMRGFEQEEDALAAVQRLNPLARPGETVAGLLMASGKQVFQAQARVQRDIDALRVIEAIRMHAAQTGSLPASLDEISVVPVPLNPATNKPFSYELKAGTATLDLPRSDGIVEGYRFELRL